MLIKFESKSNRVKGLSFHKERSWIAASLHSGVIQIWDYSRGTLIDKFEEHVGPVRGVDFHSKQPLLVSGGDDYKVKVWDYKLRRCLFTLFGHLDYIRTVQFHPPGTLPWICSASDDQTIRIWNWQSRTCISVLTGHNHYVMSASFHPRAGEDLLVSASLDQSVRVWDTSGLRKKWMKGSGGGMNQHNGYGMGGEEDSLASRVNADLFGSSDAIVKYVLEGHDRGVNWASFHPTLPLVVSGADDKQVKLWRMSDSRAWEVDTMRGHSSNVSCVIFHPKMDIIVSNSEDRSLRVWDMAKRMGIQTFRKENDRFWILAAHPSQNLLAAGHDSGMMVFKFQRERPPLDIHNGTMFYIRDRYLRMQTYVHDSERDVPIMSFPKNQISSGYGNNIRTLYWNEYNNNEYNILTVHDNDTYDLISFSRQNNNSNNNWEPSRMKMGNRGRSAIFIARNRIALINASKQIIIKNLSDEFVKKVSPPYPSVDTLFNGGSTGRFLVHADNRICLFDHQSRRVISEIQVPRIKYVKWNKDHSLVALLSKHNIIICNRELEQLCLHPETVRVKSGAWVTSEKIFVYATHTHIKYLLPNGDSGIFWNLDKPIYITHVLSNKVYFLDREVKTWSVSLDILEARFKEALNQKKFSKALSLVKNSSAHGHAIINYLEKKGYPEVALHFARDPRTKFKLALECGNIEVAMNMAYDLGDEENWERLGYEALRQGNHQVAEMAYQRVKNFEKLSFLYLITGNIENLRKMLRIADMRGDIMSKFHNALLLGNAEERVNVLEKSGQLQLAYLTAKIHGIEEAEKRIEEVLLSQGNQLPSIPISHSPELLFPPTPIHRQENWPLLNIQKRIFEELTSDKNESTLGGDVDFDDEPIGDGWDDDLDFDDGDSKTNIRKENKEKKSGWDDSDSDLDLDDDELGLGDDEFGTPNQSPTSELYTLPIAGPNATSYWVRNSTLATDHAAAGSIETAMQLLNRQISVVNFEPLRSLFIKSYTSSYGTIPGLPVSPSLRFPFQRTVDDKTGELKIPNSNSLPKVATKLQTLIEELKNSYRSFQAADFDEALDLLTHILTSIPFVVTQSRSESNEAKEMVEIAREYIIAIKIKGELGTTDDPIRILELSAYFTHCNLLPSHLILALRMAMTKAFKLKNFVNAASFANRLLELPDLSSERNSSLRSKAQKVIIKSNQMARNEHQINYDERVPFVVNCGDFTILQRGQPSIRCSYCGAHYSPDLQGQLCRICNLSLIGEETIGLVTSLSQRK